MRLLLFRLLLWPLVGPAQKKDTVHRYLNDQLEFTNARQRFVLRRIGKTGEQLFF